ncbi:MAG: hypothetical protein KatS3mg075_506 [Meiothermus sp.]|nr:MAG: hypothetical protein KatS3mg075_506 [Meiothermus sp.]
MKLRLAGLGRSLRGWVRRGPSRENREAPFFRTGSRHQHKHDGNLKAKDREKGIVKTHKISKRIPQDRIIFAS